MGNLQRLFRMDPIPPPKDDQGYTIFNQENMRRNFAAVDRCRTGVSVIGGITAGTLGLENLSGLVFFAVTIIVLFGLLCMKAGLNEKQWKEYFLNRVQTFATNSFFSAAFIYVVFGRFSMAWSMCIKPQMLHSTTRF